MEAEDSEDSELAGRIGLAWKELRRGASMSTLQTMLQGEIGLDLGQLDTLEHLVLGGDCRMSELADAMRVDASTATRAVARLVDTGLAERAHDPRDARCVKVAATAAGIRRYEELAASRRASIIEMVAGMSLADRRKLAEGMETLVAALDAFVEERTTSSAAAS
jgi:DNA-binding MarR family transcriptional regulator